MNTSLPPKPRCAECGAPLADGGVAPFCPACLWRDLTEDDRAHDEPSSPDALFTVAGHDVLAEIARGGGGIVYRARQREPRREVALKMLLPHQSTSDEMHARFRVEATAIAGLDHRAILPVYLVGEHRGIPFFTMKLAAGGTLAARQETLRGQWRAIAELVATLADAVHFAHSHGVIHRDLKPGNVLFDERARPYISDFGLAKVLDVNSSLTRTAASFGTPAYLAPEIAERGGAAATTATDVYGLGAILYELLSGRPPFIAESLPALMRKISEELPLSLTRSQSGVPRDLEVLALRCLAKNPAHRLASAGELAADLERWLSGRPVLARPVTAGEQLWRWSQRNPALAVVTSLLIGSVVIGGALLIQSNVNLKHTSARAVAAEHTAQEQLQASLISAARMTRKAGGVGQRTAALALLDQVAAAGPIESLRSEYIATLAHPDLTIDRLLPTARARSDYTVDFSSDLARLLEADSGNGFVVRDVKSSAVLQRFKVDAEEVWYLNFVAHDTMMSVGYRNGRMEVWDRDGSAPWWSGGALYGADEQPSPLAVHPSGRSLAWVAADHSIHIVDRASGSEHVAIADAGEVRLLSFNADGTVLLIVHRDRASAWSWPEAKLLWSFSGVMSPARPTWSDDGRRVAVGLTGNVNIAMLDAHTGHVEKTFAPHGADARLLAFQPGGRFLASVGWDGRLVLLDAFTGDVALQREAWVRALRFSADGRQIAFSFSHVETAVASLASVDCLREMGTELMSTTTACRLAVSPDGRWLASTDFSELRLWDTQSGRLLAKQTMPDEAWSVVTFAATGDAIIQSRRFSGLIRWPLVRTGETVSLGTPVPLGPRKPADLVTIHPATGDWWLLRFPTGQLVVWPDGRAQQEREILTAPGMDGPTPSPDGRLLLRRAYPAAGVHVLDATDARLITTLPVASALSTRWSPDGQWVVIGNSRDYTCWKTGTWERGPSWPAQIEGGSYGSTFYSPDGALLAVLQARGTLELRETKNYTLRLRLELPQDLWMHHFEWSPDGQRLYALCLGHRVMYWDLVAIRRELASRGLDWR